MDGNNDLIAFGQAVVEGQPAIRPRVMEEE
jgi:hypothetical protein